MPPWHADAPHGTFANERRLTAAEKDDARAGRGGAPEGRPRRPAAPPTFAEGWRIGKPDVVFEMQEDYAVPARGKIQYRVLLHPDELHRGEVAEGESKCGRATARSCITCSSTTRRRRTARAPPRAVQPNREHSQHPSDGSRRQTGRAQHRAPAAPARHVRARHRPAGLSRGHRAAPGAGGIFELQMHYTANGTAGTDRTRSGLIFAKEPPPPRSCVRGSSSTRSSRSRLAPPIMQVTTDVDIPAGRHALGPLPAHARARQALEYKLALPDGTNVRALGAEVRLQLADVLHVPRAAAVPKGARIVSTAWYDNSAANAQSRSDSQREMGRSDVGGDAVHRHPVFAKARRHDDRSVNRPRGLRWPGPVQGLSNAVTSDCRTVPTTERHSRATSSSRS